MASGDASTESTTDLVQKLLPTCQRCRRLRRKCDTQLPDCWLCQKAKVECTFFDHALQQVLPRAYVQSLLVQLQSLQSSKAVASALARTQALAPVSALEQPVAIDMSEISDMDNLQGNENDISQESEDPMLRDDPCKPGLHSFDQHFFFDLNGGSSRFFGSSSAVALTVHILKFAISHNVVAEGNVITPPAISVTIQPSEVDMHKLSYEPPENIQGYVAAFLDSFGELNGIIDGTALVQQDLPTYLTLRSLTTRPEELHGTQMYQYFDVSMICAIACASKARYQPDLAVKSLAFFEEVLPCVEEVTSEVSPQSLQALLLLTIFCLFWPTKGDVWRLLDYCCRLGVELGYHSEAAVDLDNGTEQNLRRSTFWGLYTLEGLVSQVFGRSPDLHEAIITTKYPHSTILVDEFGGSMPQFFPISHRYRLMHLRFEIFRDLYLPAEAANMSIDWYRDHFRTLQDWKIEFSAAAVPELLSAICNVDYHSTVCFMFQPLMLEAMTPTKNSTPKDITYHVLPSDNYLSACELIQAYERILRADRNSPLGAFPMTFVSAHFIYLASMTLMSHALFALTGQTQILKMDQTVDTSDLSAIDFSGLWVMSNSSLVLLSWCSERWPGMQGMLDVYKKLADKILPAMFKKGLM